MGRMHCVLFYCKRCHKSPEWRSSAPASAATQQEEFGTNGRRVTSKDTEFGASSAESDAVIPPREFGSAKTKAGKKIQSTCECLCFRTTPWQTIPLGTSPKARDRDIGQTTNTDANKALYTPFLNVESGAEAQSSALSMNTVNIAEI